MPYQDDMGEWQYTDAELDSQTAQLAADAAADLREAGEANATTAKALEAAGRRLEETAMGIRQASPVHAPSSETAVGEPTERRVGRDGRERDYYRLEHAGRSLSADAYGLVYEAALDARQAVEYHVMIQQYVQDMAELASYEGNDALREVEADALRAIAGRRERETDWRALYGRMVDALGDPDD